MKQAHPLFAVILGIATGLGIIMMGQMGGKNINTLTAFQDAKLE